MPDTELDILPAAFGSAAPAARYAGLSPATLYKLTKEGVIPARRRGRNLVWMREDLDRYLYGLPPRNGPMRSEENLKKARAKATELRAERKRETAGEN